MTTQSKFNRGLWEAAQKEFRGSENEDVVKQLEEYVGDRMTSKVKEAGKLASRQGRKDVLEFIESKATEHEAKRGHELRFKKVCDAVNQVKPLAVTAAAANPFASVAVAGLFFAFELCQQGQKESELKFEAATKVANIYVYAEGHSIKAAPVNGEHGDLAEMRERLRQAYIELYRKMLEIMANLLEAFSAEQSTLEKMTRKLAWLLPSDDGTWSYQLHALEGVFQDVNTKRASVDDYRQPTSFAIPGRNGLHQAAENGRSEELSRVLHEGKLDINGRSAQGWTALMFASEGGHLKCVNMLLERELDLYATNKSQNSALAIAAYNGHIRVVRALVQREKYAQTTKKRLVDMKNRDGRTAFLDAAERGHTEMVGTLFESGAVLDQTSRRGWTALHLAAEMDRYETVKYLIGKGADRNKTTQEEDRDGLTTVEVATGESKKLLMSE